jgi:hypothetical protein
LDGTACYKLDCADKTILLPRRLESTTSHEGSIQRSKENKGGKNIIIKASHSK